jgi:hypothetical protein
MAPSPWPIRARRHMATRRRTDRHGASRGSAARSARTPRGRTGRTPGQDHAVIDQAPQVVLGIENLLHRESVERIRFGRMLCRDRNTSLPRQRGSASSRAAGAKRPRARRGGGKHAVGVQHPDEGDVHEEPLYGEFLPGEVAVLQVSRDDAGIVGAVPSLARGPAQEPGPVRHTGPAHRSRLTADQQVGLPGIANEAFVDGPPPRAPGSVRTRRGEDPSTDLPSVRRPSCGSRAACNRYAPGGGSWPAESGMCCPAGLDGRFASTSALHPAGRVLTSSQRS